MERSLFEAAIAYANTRRLLHGIPSQEQSLESGRAILLRDESGSTLVRLEKSVLQDFAQEQGRPSQPKSWSDAGMHEAMQEADQIFLEALRDIRRATKGERFLTPGTSVVGSITVIGVVAGSVWLFTWQPFLGLAGFISVAPLMTLAVIADQLTRQTRLLELMLLREEARLINAKRDQG